MSLLLPQFVAGIALTDDTIVLLAFETHDVCFPAQDVCSS